LIKRDLTARNCSKEYDYSQDEVEEDLFAKQELRQEDRDDETRRIKECEHADEL